MDEAVIGPDYAAAPELSPPGPDVPRGSIRGFRMRSQNSAIYPGIRRIENDTTRRRDAYGNRIAAPAHEQSEPAPWTRRVWVYAPAQLDAARPAPFMVVQDGGFYLNRLPLVLDHLIAQGRVPPIAAVLVDSGGGDAQGSQRGLEYDTVSGLYADFVETEVLPRVTAETGLVLTDDPDQRATMGVSSGAACAFTMAWSRPDRWRRVLSYSGTYVNQQSPPNLQTPRGAWEYHAGLIAAAERKPIRVWLEVGEHDLHADDPEQTWHNWPLANRRMAAALAAKGYASRFTFSLGGQHADRRVLDQTLPGALEWLWASEQA